MHLYLSSDVLLISNDSYSALANKFARSEIFFEYLSRLSSTVFCTQASIACICHPTNTLFIIYRIFYFCMRFSRYVMVETSVSDGDGEIRTLDPLLARQVLSQLSYTPTFLCSGGLKWTRTTDLTLIRRAL